MNLFSSFLCRTIAVAAIAALSQATTNVARAEAAIGVNVLVKGQINSSMLRELGAHGRVLETVPKINVVLMRSTASQLPAIQRLSFVLAANPDAERKGVPVQPVNADSFAGGINTWDLDAVNATNAGQGRVVQQDGSGVYVAVLDTGLLDTWRYYFPQQRIATQYAKVFNGGGGESGNVSEPPNTWEHDQNSHGTHVTSSILGYNYNGTAVNGVAPKATVIPVKVLNQSGSGWSSAIARGIVYIADLKAGPLSGSPMVINMSLGGSVLDAVEKAAIDYAISKGVIVVASAGNEGTRGMGYPGAYAPVISVAAAGWTSQWLPGADGNVRNWWNADDVRDPLNAADFYIAGFSSRQKAGQDLDVTAPGSWIVGPYQVNGQLSYYYLSGTSMSSPHVAGIVALMAQKKPTLTAAAAESILQGSAVPFPAGTKTVKVPVSARFPTGQETLTWGSDATGAGLVTADAALRATK